ncbi:transposase [Streptomyces sp. RKAG293]|uniref:transposase n=1 Tax=Streptomyces sp. RKAG293 TaxID=2893403 RepID=UPI0035A8B594
MSTAPGSDGSTFRTTSRRTRASTTTTRSGRRTAPPEKKIKGRKRHLITDTLSLALAVIVTAASVHDSTGGKRLLDELATTDPSVSKVRADGGYRIRL